MRFAICRTLALLVATMMLGCDNASGPPPINALQLELVASGFNKPLFLASPPGDARLFVAEKGGQIRLIIGGAVQATPFLDIASRLDTNFYDHGLLGLAFHPNFASNGRFFVFYTDKLGVSQIDRYTTSPAANVADTTARLTILSIPHPGEDHHAGMLEFAPDGKLLIGTGDGGMGFSQNAQDRTSLLGKILRIDVDNGSPYSIPADNPYVGSATLRAEIWGFGLRNPWRFSVDPVTRLLYIGDVGSSNFEEVDVASVTEKGINWGWDVMEGSSCNGASSCAAIGRAPILEYPHTDGCAILGGYVYRGVAMPSLHGTYFYSDFCSGFIRSFVVANGEATNARSWNVGETGLAQAIGRDASGELYLLLRDGQIFRLAPAVPTP